MAQYFTDFGSYTTGVAPSDWTERFSSDATWTVEADASVTGGKVLRVDGLSTQGRNMLSWDEIDGDADRADIETLTRFKFYSGGNDVHTLGVSAVRGAGSSGSETAYRSYLNEGTDEIGLTFYDNGAVDGAVIAGSSTAETFYWQRFRVEGTSLKLRTWTGGIGDEPATWDIETTDSSITAAGWVGVFQFRENRVEWDLFGVGTNGDTAPSEALVSADPANLAVTVSGSTASLSWDASPLLT